MEERKLLSSIHSLLVLDVSSFPRNKEAAEVGHGSASQGFSLSLAISNAISTIPHDKQKSPKRYARKGSVAVLGSNTK